MKTVYIDPEVLQEHPSNEFLYGSTTVEPALVESIRTQGVMQTLLVTQIGEDYFIVSGHRRRKAAIEAGRKKVPCHVREYPNLSASEIDLIESNMMRQKSEQSLAREAESMIDHYTMLAEKRKLATLRASGNQTNGEKAEKPTFGDSEPGRTDDLVADLLGFSRNKLRNLLTVFGEKYQAEKLQTIKGAGGNVAGAADAWNEIRYQRLDDKISLSSAYTAVLDLIHAACQSARETNPKMKSGPIMARLRFQTIDWENDPDMVVYRDPRLEMPDGYPEVALGDYNGTICLLVDNKAAVLDSKFFTQFSTQ